MDGERLSLAGGALLEAWESASGLPRPWAELALLAGASGRAIDELARLPIGRRDALLLRLHEAAIGEVIECETDCPACGERLELAVDAGTLAIAGEGPRADGAIGAGEWTATVRPADSLDVAAAMDADAAGYDATAAILERCTVDIRRAGRDVAADPPPALLAAADERLGALDPGADLELDLACPACGHRWSHPLDPPTFVLAGVEARAFRLLAEVDALARAYGWREPDVLALSPERRRRYLELALA